MAFVAPNRIVIDFLEGVTNKSDAIAYARGFITSHFEVPDQSGYYVMQMKDGYAYEVHEGGSRKAYLPAIMKVLADAPDATVSVRSGSRVLQVSKGPRGNFNSVLLPEELSSYLENVIEPDPKSPSLTPFQMDNIVWLFVGSSLAVLGVLVFILSLGFFALDPSISKPPKLNVTDSKQLPLAQWENMMSQLTGNNYITAMRFQGGQWSFETRNNNDAGPSANNDQAPTPGSLPPVPPPEEQPSGPVILSPEQAPPQAPVPPPSPTGIPSGRSS